MMRLSPILTMALAFAGPPVTLALPTDDLRVAVDRALWGTSPRKATRGSSVTAACRATKSPCSF